MGTIMQQTAVLILRLIVIQLPVRLFCSLWRYQCTYLIIAKFHYTDPTRTRHEPDPTRTKSAHIVGDELNSTTRTRTRTGHGPDTDPTGPSRTRTYFFCGETPLGPCGSGRVRVVEFSSYPTTCADFVRVRSVSGPCSGI